jgi:hypothetical protein
MAPGRECIRSVTEGKNRKCRNSTDKLSIQSDRCLLLEMAVSVARSAFRSTPRFGHAVVRGLAAAAIASFIALRRVVNCGSELDELFSSFGAAWLWLWHPGRAADLD